MYDALKRIHLRDINQKNELTKEKIYEVLVFFYMKFSLIINKLF